MMGRVTELPPPHDLAAPVPRLVVELATHLAEPRAVSVCVELLQGADREDHLAVLPYLTGLSFETGSPRRDPASWADHWVRTWGARGLLYVWEESAAPAVVSGLADEHWRPAEMCLKVATRREIGAAGDGAVALSAHELPRVRAQAVRALGVVGDTEHVAAVRARLDDEAEPVRRQARRALELLVSRLDLVGEG
jgi:hypothetical protein